MTVLVTMGIGPNEGKTVRVPFPVGADLVKRGDAIDAMAVVRPEPMAGMLATPKASPKRRRRKGKR